MPAGVRVSRYGRIRADLGAAMSGAGGALAIADRLCHACVKVLQVDGVSLSLTIDGIKRGTFGASSPLSRHLDELQFTFGEGPCLDATNSDGPILVADLTDPTDTRWPAFTGAVLEAGISSVFALPVRLSAQPVGALDLFRVERGPLPDATLAGGLLAAELAALPLLELLVGSQDSGGQTDDGWVQLASLERLEVYQATGMIMAALDVDAAEALVRLRARAFATGTTAGQVAWSIVERRVSLDSPDWQDLPGPAGPP